MKVINATVTPVSHGLWRVTVTYIIGSKTRSSVFKTENSEYIDEFLSLKAVDFMEAIKSIQKNFKYTIEQDAENLQSIEGGAVDSEEEHNIE